MSSALWVLRCAVLCLITPVAAARDGVCALVRRGVQWLAPDQEAPVGSSGYRLVCLRVLSHFPPSPLSRHVFPLRSTNKSQEQSEKRT